MGLFKKIVTLEILSNASELVQAKIESINDKIKSKKESRREKCLENLKTVEELYNAGTISKRDYKKQKKDIMKQLEKIRD